MAHLPEATLRVRMSGGDAGRGAVIPGARLLDLFGDVAAELTVRHDGDEGMLAGYDSVEFLAPVFAGDFIEATGRMVNAGRTSRRCVFEARRYVAFRPEVGDSAADLLDQPEVVARAVGTTVVGIGRQRGPEAELLRRDEEHLVAEDFGDAE